jgi:hypothetical protein
MKSVLPIYLFEPFTPEMVATMQAAFDEACMLVGCKEDDEAREAIGLHIIEGAQRGIRGVTQLRDAAVAHWQEIKKSRSRPATSEPGAAAS